MPNRNSRRSNNDKKYHKVFTMKFASTTLVLSLISSVALAQNTCNPAVSEMLSGSKNLIRFIQTPHHESYFSVHRSKLLALLTKKTVMNT